MKSTGRMTEDENGDYYGGSQDNLEEVKISKIVKLETRWP